MQRKRTLPLDRGTRPHRRPSASPARALAAQTTSDVVDWSGPRRWRRSCRTAPCVSVGSTRANRSTFDVTLAPSHAAELASLMRNLYDPSSPRVPALAAPGEFARRFGPNPARRDARSSAGCTASASPTRTWSTVASRCTRRRDCVERARCLVRPVPSRRRHRERSRRSEAPLVPRALARDITAIVGLSDTAHLQPHLQVLTAPGSIRPALSSHATSCAASIQQQANSLGGWTTRQIGTKYQVAPLLNAGLNGAGKTIAIYELAPHTPADTSAYLSCFGLHNSRDDESRQRRCAQHRFGWHRRSEPRHRGRGRHRARREDHLVRRPEHGARLHPRVVRDRQRRQGASRSPRAGASARRSKAPANATRCTRCSRRRPRRVRSIFAATGDSGSEDCLFANGSTGARGRLTGQRTAGHRRRRHVDEAERRDHEPEPRAGVERLHRRGRLQLRGDGGGGAAAAGFRRVYAKPSWQPAAGASTCHPGCREVPDLAANAGVGEAFLSGGLWSLIGGTSIASPKLAGIAADIVKGCVDPLGPVQPQGVRARARGRDLRHRAARRAGRSGRQRPDAQQRRPLLEWQRLRSRDRDGHAARDRARVPRSDARRRRRPRRPVRT